MQMYEAFLKAADFIEQNPGRLHMSVTHPPRGPQDQGCILAWVGHFAGIKFDHADDVLTHLPHCSFGDFISGLNKIDARMQHDIIDAAPRVMRLYAERALKGRDYSRASSMSLMPPQITFFGIPPSVAKIFSGAEFEKEFEKVA
jgi:hypothetical protein